MACQSHLLEDDNFTLPSRVKGLVAELDYYFIVLTQGCLNLNCTRLSINISDSQNMLSPRAQTQSQPIQD